MIDFMAASVKPGGVQAHKEKSLAAPVALPNHCFDSKILVKLFLFAEYLFHLHLSNAHD